MFLETEMKFKPAAQAVKLFGEQLLFAVQCNEFILPFFFAHQGLQLRRLFFLRYFCLVTKVPKRTWQNYASARSAIFLNS